MSRLATVLPLACVGVLGSCAPRKAVSLATATNAWAAQTESPTLAPAVLAAALLQQQQQQQRLIVTTAHQSRAAYQKLAQLTDGVAVVAALAQTLERLIAVTATSPGK